MRSLRIGKEFCPDGGSGWLQIADGSIRRRLDNEPYRQSERDRISRRPYREGLFLWLKDPLTIRR